MNPTDAKIIDVLAHHPGATSRFISQQVGFTAKYVAHRIVMLRNSGLVIRGGYKNRPTYRLAKRTHNTYQAADDLRERYAQVLGSLDRKLGILDDGPAADWLMRYLFTNGSIEHSTLFEKATRLGRSYKQKPRVIFAAPLELWRLKARLAALETLDRLPVTMIKSLMQPPIPITTSGRRATITEHERGEVSPFIRGVWHELHPEAAAK